MQSKFAAGLVLLLTWPMQSAFGASVGQIDTFEDGTTNNWLVGLLGAPHPAPPVNVPTGGPGGVDDNYLLLTAVGGSGPGNRLTVINPVQWTGDFIAAGIGGISMDVNNLGDSDLSLRLHLSDPIAGPPANAAISTNAVFVPAGSGWMSVYFSLLPADLTAVAGDVNNALTNVTELRLFHSPAPGYPGPSVTASLGVDNITALPEPGGFVLLGSALTALLIRRRASRD